MKEIKSGVFDSKIEREKGERERERERETGTIK